MVHLSLYNPLNERVSGTNTEGIEVRCGIVVLFEDHEETRHAKTRQLRMEDEAREKVGHIHASLEMTVGLTRFIQSPEGKATPSVPPSVCKLGELVVHLGGFASGIGFLEVL